MSNMHFLIIIEYLIIIFLYSIVSLYFLAICKTKIAIIFILLKLFDIFGPPIFLKDFLRKKIKKYVKKNANCNKIKRKKNAIYLIVPHGATFFPIIQLPLLLDMEDEYPIVCINKWFLLIPGFVGILKFFSGFISTEKGNLKIAILQKARPLIIYPNGAKEALYNSYKNKKIRILDIKEKFLQHLFASKRYIHIVMIKNESECFFFNNFVIMLYRFINNFIDVGIPFPLPYFSGKKLKMHISKAINTSKIDNIDQLKKIIREKVDDLR